MALNPEIALGYRPPQVNLDVPSPIQQFGQMMSMRALMEQSQMRQMQMQQEKMQLEGLQRANAGEAEFRRRLGAGETLTPAQTMGVLGSQRGVQYLKSAADLEESQHKANIQKFNRLGSIIGSATDTPTYNRAVMQAHAEGYFDPATARQLITQGFDPARVAQYQRMAMTGEQQAKYALDQAAAKRQEQETTARLAKERGELLAKGSEFAAQTVPNDPAAWPGWRAKIAQAYPGLESYLPEEHSGAAYQLVRQFGVKSQAPPALMPPEVLKQQKELHAPQPAPAMSPERLSQELQLRQAGAAKGNKEDAEALADTVISNPALWDQLTPTARTNTAPILAKKGYAAFGKPMAESALGKLAESRGAVESLRDLRQTLKENEQYIGPISGFQALNPYSEARQAQAKIDLVKQRVGRALEGGVLRKEDEEKYKKILATLNDTPSTAIAKVDNVIETLQRDIKLFEDEQRRGGRNVVSPAGETSAGAAPVTRPTAAPNAPTVGTVKAGSDGTQYRYTGGDPGNPKSWQLVLRLK